MLSLETWPGMGTLEGDTDPAKELMTPDGEGNLQSPNLNFSKPQSS